MGSSFLFFSCNKKIVLREELSNKKLHGLWVYHVEGIVYKSVDGVQSSYSVRESGFESSLEKAWAKIGSFEPKIGKGDKFVPRVTKVSQEYIEPVPE